MYNFTWKEYVKHGPNGDFTRNFSTTMEEGKWSMWKMSTIRIFEGCKTNIFYNKSRSLLKNQRAVNGCNKMFLLCHYNISSCPEILITSRLILQRSINLKWIVNAGARWDWNYLLVVAIFSYFHLGINLGNFWDILWGRKS